MLPESDCGKSFGVQRHDEIGLASLSACTEGIMSRIGRDVWQSGGGNKIRPRSQQIDYLPDEWTQDAQPSQDSLVFQKNLIAARQTYPLRSSPEQIGAWILGSDLR